LTTSLTCHAELRLQQRNVPRVVVEALGTYGSVQRRRDADSLFFDKAAKRRLRADLEGTPLLETLRRYLHTYMICSDDGAVVTVAFARRQSDRSRRRR
jgi:hypothetical protein